MSCVIYKGSEKLLVDPVALQGMLAQGWSLQPESPDEPISVEEFEEFLNLHERLKRVSDDALSARDAQIANLTQQNEQLTEDIEVLEAENIQLRGHFVAAMEELKAFKEQAPKLSPVEPDPVPDKAAHKDYSRMTIQELSEHAKRAKITNIKSKRKAELIEALQLWELQDGSANTD